VSPDRDRPESSVTPGGASKRPAPTIEGTATEVHPDPEASSRAAEEPARPQDAGGSDTDPREAHESRPPAGGGRPRRSVTSHLIALLLGAGLAVLGLYFAWDRLPVAQESAMPAALDQRLQALEARGQIDPDRLIAIEEQLDAIEDRAGDAADTQVIDERLTWLEDTIRSLAESAQEGGAVPDAAALATQLAEAEKRLEARLEARLERQTREQRIDETELLALRERLATIEAAMPVLSGAVDRQAGEAKTAALTLAFANLRAAVRSGEPYGPQLSAVAALAPADLDFEDLAAHAENGIPTLNELSLSFKESADAVLQQDRTPADGSVLDRLLASAQSVITVRRVGEVEGASADAVLARAKAKLDRGEIAEAVSEVQSLPQAEREAFAAWLAEARANLTAEATLTRLENTLLVSIGADRAEQP
jgi:hypothetical protein